MRAPGRILAFSLIVALSACSNKMELNDEAVPKTLLIGVYAGHGPEEIVNRHEPIRQYLEAKLQMPVEVVKVTDYTALIEALRAKKIHMADLPPFAYVLAKEKTDIDVMVTMGVGGNPSKYQSVIITGKNSGISSIEEMKSKASKLTFAFSDPASASGHLIPRAYLNSIGLNSKTAFKEMIFASGHLESVMAVKSGKVDVGCSVLLVKRILMERGMMKDDDIKVLWTSDPIVSDPIVIRHDINKKFAEKVKQAYLDLSTTAPSVLKDYVTRIYGKAKGDSLSYIPAHDSLYNGLRKIASGVTDFKDIQ